MGNKRRETVKIALNFLNDFGILNQSGFTCKYVHRFRGISYLFFWESLILYWPFQGFININGVCKTWKLSDYPRLSLKPIHPRNGQRNWNQAGLKIPQNPAICQSRVPGLGLNIRGFTREIRGTVPCPSLIQPISGPLYLIRIELLELAQTSFEKTGENLRWLICFRT